MYEIRFTPAADRQFKKLPSQVSDQLQSVIESLSQEPRPPGVKKMRSYDNTWRVRSGDYRIIDEIQDRQLIILVVNVGPRREVYR